MSHCLNAGKGCVMWGFGGIKQCQCGCETCAPPRSVTWRRGEADGRNGHPPAEVTSEYLRGYAQGLDNKP